MGSRTATLADVNLTAHAPIRWGRRAGVTPYTSTIITSKDRAEAIFAATKGKPTTLKFEEQTFKGIWVLNIGPGPAPHLRTLYLADVRWMLPRIYVVLDANIKRISVERRLQGDNLVTAVQRAETLYAPHSLNNSVPFTAKTFLQRLMELVVRELKNIADVDVAVKYDATNFPELEVVDWRLDAPADQAISKTMGLVPGVNLDVDEEGALRIFPEYGLFDRGEISGLVPYADGPNDYPVIKDNTHLAPRQIYVMFDRAMEIRFNYDESRILTTSESARNPSFDLVNMIQVNEPEVTISGVTYGFGSWITIYDYVTWLGTLTRPAPAQITECQPSMAWLRKHFYSGFSKIRWKFIVGNGDTDQLWVRRFQTLLNHYRQTFMVSQYWYDQLLGLEAVRATVYDPVRNVRAPAEAYCSYTTRPTSLGFDFTPGAGKVKFTMVNDVYRDNLAEAPTSAPFEVRVEDHDAMVIRLVPRQDYSLEGELPTPGLPIVPCEMEVTRFLNQGTLGQSQSKVFWEEIELQEEWKLAIVLTAWIGTPNDRVRLHEEAVLPDEAQKVVNTLNIDRQFTGPAMYVRIDPGLLAARSVWLDSQSELIYQTIYAGANLRDEIFHNKKTVRDVAVAAAARIWESMASRLSGNRTRVAFKPEMKPNSALGEVEHVLDTDGRLMTQFSFYSSFEARDLLAFLPDGTRRILQRAVGTERRR